MNKDELKTFAVQFGKSMAVARKNKGMSFKDLANKTGSSNVLLWKAEAGQVSVGCVRAIKIAEALDLDIYSMYQIKNN